MGEADRRRQSDRRRPGTLESDVPLRRHVRLLTARRRYQDGVSGDALSLAQKGVGQFVIFVDDVDAVRVELDHAKVTPINGPADRDWGMRTLTPADPGGYTWEITQELPGASGAS